MKTAIFKNNWFTAMGLVLIIPAAYFVMAGILSEFGVNGPIEFIQPLAERWGIKEPPGINITSVILFGPLVAFLLTVFQFVKIEWHLSKEEFLLHFSMQKKWFPMLVAAFSAGLLLLLFIYLLGENCNC